ncbi:MAG: HAD-IIIC family phosphatase, partial [Opitutales bacterium]|nr:HAD-IIIC family phosphatase [Opitutales bacterium]
RGVKLDLREAPYNQIDFELFDKNSQLGKSAPEYIIIFQSAQKLMELHALLDLKSRKSLAAKRCAFVKSACKKFPQSKIICLNYAEIDDGVFGSFANKAEDSFLYQTRKLNFFLARLAAKTPNLRVCDILSEQSRIGSEKFFSPELYASAEIAIAPDALPQVCEKIFAIAAADSGAAKKCAVLDLDNFLWGGTVGDDGAENLQISSGLGIGRAFANIQLWCKKLKERGIILAACSKNDEAAAREPFLKLKEMRLGLSDFSAFAANWKPKSQNIVEIAKALNIGLDSIVFLDDSAAERAEVRQSLPQVCVPELPDDPALYLDFLSAQNLFEAAGISEADALRSKFYADESARKQIERGFKSHDAFLKSLKMSAHAEEFSELNAPRVAQLLQRTNQFNMRSKRYSQGEILSLASDKNFRAFAFSLGDKIGESGIVAAAILREMPRGEIFIDTFVLSCRAFGRGLEFFAFNKILEYAKSRGFKKISAEFIPTQKNKIAADFYLKAGFAQTEDLGGSKKFALETKSAKPIKTFIKQI